MSDFSEYAEYQEDISEEVSRRDCACVTGRPTTPSRILVRLLWDATDNLRNLNTLSTTAIGVALSQYVLTGDPKYGEMIEQAQRIVSNGADN